MTKPLSPAVRLAILAGAAALVAGAMMLTQAIPPVVGLGERVRLPIFHGASTWVNMGTLTILGVVALAYLLLRAPRLYAWVAGFRFVGAGMWIANMVLGGLAAKLTWDFTGSPASPLVIAQADPRLMVQLQLVLLVAALLVAGWLIESDRWRAVMDVAFVAVMWAMLGSVLMSPEARALHPDNPVMNSGPEIQTPFFAILAALSLAILLLVVLVQDQVARSRQAKASAMAATTAD